MKKRFRQCLIISLMSLGLLQGCLFNSPQPDDPDFAPAQPLAKPENRHAYGSIYQDNFGLNLFENRQAWRVGDTVTVMLEEKTTSSANASTSASKDMKYEMDNPSLFGHDMLVKPLPFFPLTSSTDNSNFAVKLKSNPAFTGTGSTSQDNELKGSITVTIFDVLSNGNLMVRGEKWIYINKGEEFVRLTGIINPKDIDATNQISSSKVANARISYSTKGDLSDSNTPGWISSVFFKVFWPF